MSDATIEILQQIREDIAQLSARTDARFDGVHAPRHSGKTKGPMG